MKIAVVTPSFPPYRGGIGNVAREFAQGIARHGHTVHVYTPSRKGQTARRFSDKNSIHSRFAVIRLPAFIRYGQAAFVPGLYAWLSGYDIIHLHFPFIGGAEATLLARIMRPSQKLVVHYHMDLVGKRWRRIIFFLYTRFFLPLLIQRADLIVSTSADYQRHSLIARSAARTPGRFSVIANGVHTTLFRSTGNTDEVLKKLSIGNKRIVLFVGALDSAHYFKGVPILLQAWSRLSERQLPPRKLVIVGTGNATAQYAELAWKLNIGHEVIFTGAVTDKELPAFYRAAHVTVLPSVDMSEAFGLVLVESMAAGTPVIASNLPGVRSVVEHGKNGWLIEPRDAGALADTLSSALIETKRDSMGAYAQSYAERYDWNVLTVTLEKIFTMVLRNS